MFGGIQSELFENQSIKTLTFWLKLLYKDVRANCFCASLLSVDTSAECQSICRSTYRPSVGRYVDRDVSVDVLTDVSTEISAE